MRWPRRCPRASGRCATASRPLARSTPTPWSAMSPRRGIARARDDGGGEYVPLAALVAPALIRTGKEPIAAHLYVLYFAMMSMITPLIALAAYAAASIAGAPAMATGLAVMRFGWSAFVIPVLFVFSPTLMIGAPLDIGHRRPGVRRGQGAGGEPLHDGGGQYPDPGTDRGAGERGARPGGAGECGSVAPTP